MVVLRAERPDVVEERVRRERQNIAASARSTSANATSPATTVEPPRARVSPDATVAPPALVGEVLPVVDTSATLLRRWFPNSDQSRDKKGTSYGPELLVRLRGGRRRAQLEDRLRELVRDGTLDAGSRMPSSRALAGDLGVSRRLVVDAYAQLLAEGYLVARQGAGTFVAAAGALERESPAPPAASALRFDFFPGAPDLASFPRTLWLRATREVLRGAPDSAFAYPDARGAPALRAALAAYLRRVRGVVVEPDAIVVCSGATQGLALLGRALPRLGISSIDVEDPGLPPHRGVLAYAGLDVRGVPVDEQGVDVGALRAPVALTTPAHQCPTGVVLSPRRRGELVRWARDGGLVIEDDYDAEFRYDRAPLGALQGLAPDRVVYLGTVSKTLAPGLRLGWLVLPP